MKLLKHVFLISLKNGIQQITFSIFFVESILEQGDNIIFRFANTNIIKLGCARLLVQIKIQNLYYEKNRKLFRD